MELLRYIILIITVISFFVMYALVFPWLWLQQSIYTDEGGPEKVKVLTVWMVVFICITIIGTIALVYLDLKYQ